MGSKGGLVGGGGDQVSGWVGGGGVQGWVGRGDRGPGVDE